MSVNPLADDTHASSFEQLLRGLGLPPTVAQPISPETTPADLVRLAPTLVTSTLARQLWLDWHGDGNQIADPRFLDAVRKLLRDCVAMGFGLGRLREPTKRLVRGTSQRAEWMACLEDAVSDCGLRVSVDPQSHATWFTELTSVFDTTVEGIFGSLGVVVPRPNVTADPALSHPSFRVEWNDIQLPAWRGLPQDRVLVNDTVHRLNLLSIEAERAVDPKTGSEWATIPSSMASVAQQAGLTVWNTPDHFARTVDHVLTANASAFVNRSQVDLLLFQLLQVAPETVHQAKEKLPGDLIVQALRGMLAEEISIRNLSLILDSMLMFDETVDSDLSKYVVFDANPGAVYASASSLAELAPEAYVDTLRTHLKRYISHKYTRGESTLLVYLLDPQLEQRLARPTELTDKERAEFLRAVNDQVGNLPPTARTPVVLTTVRVRRRVREEVELQHPHLAVLSYQELSPDMNIQPLARISPG